MFGEIEVVRPGDGQAVAVVGPRGLTLHTGNITPSSGVGNDGDGYIDVSAGRFYGPKADGAWPSSYTSLVGPEGSVGGLILKGTSSPSDSTGKDGDFYMDRASSTFYGPKTAGSWPFPGLSLIGFHGPGNQLTIGGIVMLPPGSVPTVEITGSAPTQFLNLGIPVGSVIHTGSAPPLDNGLGYDGEFYIALIPGDRRLYGPKASGAWPTTYLSLNGPPGPSGPGTGSVLPSGAFQVGHLAVMGDIYGTTIVDGGDPAQFAPLASPPFTGTPTAPTAVQGDASSLVATTGFVAVASAEIAYLSQDARAMRLINAGQSGIDRQNGVATIADSYNDTSDVLSNIGGAYDGTNHLFTQTIASYTAQSGTPMSGGDVTGHAAALAFDGNAGTYWQASQAPASIISAPAYIGIDLGTAKEIRRVAYTSGGIASVTPGSCAVQYSDDAAAWTTAPGTTFAPSLTAGVVSSVAVPALDPHRYWRVVAVSGPPNGWQVPELTFSTATYSDMTIASVGFTSDIASPKLARVLVQLAANSQPITLNTDLVAYASRNGGANWSVGTLAYVESMADGSKMYETGLISLSAQPAGSSMAYKVGTANSKRVGLAGALLQWRP